MDKLEQSLKKYALYLLGRRSYSVGEMRSKLVQKLQLVHKVRKVRKVNKGQNANSFNPSVIPDSIRDLELMIEKIIVYLTNLNLLDDEAYAKSLVESLQRQNKSRRQIMNKLNIKQIEKNIIEKVLTTDKEVESKALSKLIASKLRYSPTLLSTKNGKDNLIRFLVYRGFDYGDIKKEIQNMNDK